MPKTLTVIAIAITLIIVMVLTAIVLKYFVFVMNERAVGSTNFIVVEDFVGRSVKIPNNISR
ncbi:MAG: hypothetical protein QXF79_06790, partial [Ignisphaera sp.]